MIHFGWLVWRQEINQYLRGAKTDKTVTKSFVGGVLLNRLNIHFSDEKFSEVFFAFLSVSKEDSWYLWRGGLVVG